MDIGLKKIIDFKKELEEKSGKLNAVLMKKNKKNEDNDKLKEEERNLLNLNKGIISNKEELEYYMNNIKKFKKKKIIFTALMILIVEIALIICSVLNSYFNLSLIIYFNIFLIPVSFLFGDVNDYSGAKKFLKNNKLEDIEKELKENQKQLNLNKEKQNNIENELNDLKNNENLLRESIQSLRAEIEKINNIRTDIINNYISDNRELDQLLNKAYNIYEKEGKTKQFIKE